MRSYSLLLLTLLMSCIVIGQSNLTNFTLSNIDDKVQQQTTMGIGTIGDQYFSVHRKTVGKWVLKKTYTAVTYDQDLNVTNTNVLVLKVGKDFTRYDILQNIGGHLYLFSSYPKNKTHINTYYVREFDPKTLEPTGPEKAIATIPYAKGGRNNSGTFWVEKSPDHSKIMVYYKLPWTRKGGLKFGVVVYDSTFTKLWEKEHEVPYNNKQYELANWVVDNIGNAYVMGRSRKENKQGYDFISFTENGNNIKTHKADVPVDFVSTITCYVTKDDQIVIAGFTSSGGRYSDSGAYYHRFDSKTQAFVVKNHAKFDTYRFLDPNTVAKAAGFADDDNTGVYSSIGRHDKTILKKDGGVFILAEEYSKVMMGSKVNGVTDSDTTYDYNNISVINISPQGDVLWARTIPKRQHTKNDWADYSSFIAELIGDDLVLLFNDHKDNLDRDPDKKRIKFKGSRSKAAVVVMKYTLDAAGSIQKDTVINDEDKKTYINPWKSINPDQKELIFFIQKWGLLEKYKKYTLSRLK